MDVFGTTQLASFADNKPVRLTVDGLVDEKLYLTSIRGEINPNYQLMYTIGRGQYLNSFSHRLSLFTIQGIYVLVDCNGPLDNVGEPPFMIFYKKHNINTSSKSVRITFNNIVITGFLVKLSLGNYQQEGRGDVDGHMFTLLFLGAIDGLNPPPRTTQAGASTERGSSAQSGYPALADELTSSAAATELREYISGSRSLPTVSKPTKPKPPPTDWEEMRRIRRRYAPDETESTW